MDVTINRLDPNVPDPVESRRRAAGRLVRFAYATVVFGVLGFFVIYFGAPFVYLGGPGTVTAPRHVVSLPFTVQVTQMKLVPGATVKAGEEIAEVISPEQDNIVATYTAFRRRVHAEQGHALRDRLATWAAGQIAAMTAARPEMPSGIEDRDADVWESLLAIADAAGADWPQRARDAAVALVRHHPALRSASVAMAHHT